MSRNVRATGLFMACGNCGYRKQFHQAIDVDFGNSGNVTPDDTPAVISQWSKTLSGQIAGNNLNTGDKVIARFFDANGEVAALRTELSIGSVAREDANQWSPIWRRRSTPQQRCACRGERMKRAKLSGSRREQRLRQRRQRPPVRCDFVRRAEGGSE